MVGSLGIGIALIIIGLIATVALPWAGLFIGLILIVVAILLIIGAFAAGRRGTTAPPR
ncbi:MAG: hypothetical protein ACRDM1_15730 [Gaiellaceae bacterium]